MQCSQPSSQRRQLLQQHQLQPVPQTEQRLDLHQGLQLTANNKTQLPTPTQLLEMLQEWWLQMQRLRLQGVPVLHAAAHVRTRVQQEGLRQQ
jgi:hypothetical protein